MKITEAELREVFENKVVYHPAIMSRWPDTGEYKDNEIRAGWRHTVRVLRASGILGAK